MCNSTDVAEALLRDVDNDTERSETDLSSPGVTLVFGDTREGGGAAAQLQVGAGHLSQFFLLLRIYVEAMNLTYSLN